MHESQHEVIKVSAKPPVEDYIVAVLTGLRNSPSVIIEGLGCVQGKVIAVARFTAEFAGAQIESIESFDLDGLEHEPIAKTEAAIEVLTRFQKRKGESIG